jgi:starch-binding outer membrane protein, SusD/RagB family
MMKKSLIKIYVFTLLISIVSVSCQDFLEDAILDQVSEEAIYTTVNGLETGVNGLYNQYRYYNAPAGEAGGGGIRSQMFFMAADDLGQFRTYTTPYQAESHTPNGFPSFKWVEGYQLIDRCNAIIQNSENISVEGAELTRMNRIVAQARVMRAELYLDIIRMYDNILLDTTATTAENANDPITYEVADPVAVFEVIDGDLDFAIEHLNYTEDYGRYNKSVARHLKGKSNMWQAQYLPLTGITSINVNAKYQEAANQFDALINESGRNLVPIAQVFGENLNHSEMLFAIIRDEDLGSTGAGDNLAGGAGTWLGAVFTNRLYENGAGLFIHDAEYGGEALGWAYPNNYLQELYGTLVLPDPAKPWARHIVTNDLRYTTYFYPETYVSNNPNSARFGEVIPVTDYEDNIRRYHFSSKKFYDAEKGDRTNDSWKDYPMYRLAETFLLGAEAHSNLGETAIALEYMNKVRRRAFGLDVNAAAPAVDFTSWTLDTYLEESARELNLERNRWFLLKRLGILLERQRLHYRFGATAAQVVTNQYPMADHMVRLPIPQQQIDLMKTFPQNDDY